MGGVPGAGEEEGKEKEKEEEEEGWETCAQHCQVSLGGC